jgi:hypothetical protein
MLTAIRPSSTAYMRVPTWPSSRIIWLRMNVTGASSHNPRTMSASDLRIEHRRLLRDVSPSWTFRTPSSFARATASRSRATITFISMSAKAGFFASALRNCLESSAISLHGVFATAVALRGVRASAAISPKISPAFTERISCAAAVRLTRPLSRRYILSRPKSERRPCHPRGRSSGRPESFPLRRRL